MQITVKRIYSDDSCTIGELTIGDFKCYTVERPWLDNKPRVSCIPPGTYKFTPHGWETNAGTKFKKVWRLLNVPGRSAILIHGGNTSMSVIGCLAVGEKRGTLDGHEAVLNSQATLNKLREIIGEHCGEITIG